MLNNFCEGGMGGCEDAQQINGNLLRKPRNINMLFLSIAPHPNWSRDRIFGTFISG